MKFNEYGIMKYAFSPHGITREGYMQKQGANYQYYKREASFKTRYFVLKGNMLFYFRQKLVDLIGFILIEECKVTRMSDLIFSISFLDENNEPQKGENIRTYILKVNSENECSAWIRDLQISSMAQSTPIHDDIDDHNDDDKGVSFDLNNSFSFKIKASITDDKFRFLFCTIQIYSVKGKEWETIETTEIQPLINSDPASPSTMIADFMTLPTVPQDKYSSTKVFRIYLIGTVESMILTAKKSAHSVLGYSEFSLADCQSKIKLSKNVNIISKSILRGSVSVTVVNEVFDRNHRQMDDSKYQRIFQSPYGTICKISMKEPDFAVDLPLKYLSNLLDFEKEKVSKLRSMFGAYGEGRKELSNGLKLAWNRQSFFHEYLCRYIQKAIETISNLKGDFSFRKSVDKKDESLQWIPINLQLQSLSCKDLESNDFGKVCAFFFPMKDQFLTARPLELWGSVTCGCPSGHFFGFKNGGLETLSKPWLAYFHNSHIYESKQSMSDQMGKNYKIHGLRAVRGDLYSCYTECTDALESLLQLWKDNAATPLSQGPDTNVCERLLQKLSISSLQFCNIVKGDGKALFTDGNGRVLDQDEFARVQDDCQILKRNIEADFIQACRFVSHRARLDYENECLNEEYIAPMNSDPKSLGDWMEQLNNSYFKYKSCLNSILESVVVAFERLVFLDNLDQSGDEEHKPVASSKDKMTNDILLEDPDLNNCPSNYQPVMEPIAVYLRHHMVNSQFLCIICAAFSQKFFSEWSKLKSYLSLKDEKKFKYGINAFAAWLWQCFDLGWLVGMETLLNWNGDEGSMLEDVIFVVNQAYAGGLAINVRPSASIPGKDDEKYFKDLITDKEEFQYEFNFCGDLKAIEFVIPRPAYNILFSHIGMVGSPKIKIIPILYGKGINESPSVSQYFGNRTFALEGFVNSSAVKVLKNYHRAYSKFVLETWEKKYIPNLKGFCEYLWTLVEGKLHPEDSMVSVVQAKFDTLEYWQYYQGCRFPITCNQVALSEISDLLVHVDNLQRLSGEENNQSSERRNKKTEFLTHFEAILWLMSAGRVTFCKSGKDRTAMATTLEQAIQISWFSDRIMSGATAKFSQLSASLDDDSMSKNWLTSILEASFRFSNLSSSDLEKLVQYLRGKHGLRLDLVKRNTGATFYAISSLQSAYIPKAYRPIIQQQQ